MLKRESLLPSFDIPLSADSRDILSYIDKPLVQRKPVGYQSYLLETYLPNQTFYLSHSLRTQLHNMGDMGLDKLPASTYTRTFVIFRRQLQ